MSNQTPDLEFFIPGIPKPGGSKKTWIPRKRDGTPVLRKNGSIMVNVVDDCKKNADWRTNCAFFARQAIGSGAVPLGCQMSVHFIFTFPRPGGHYRSNGDLKPLAPAYHSTTPDATKCIRSTEDAMKGILWVDDKLIVDQHATKLYGDQPGCLIRVWKLAGAVQPPMPKLETPPLFAEVG